MSSSAYCYNNSFVFPSSTLVTGFFLVKINTHDSCSLHFPRPLRDTVLAEIPVRIWSKTTPRLLDQQWSCRVQATREVLFIGELALALAQ